MVWRAKKLISKLHEGNKGKGQHKLLKRERYLKEVADGKHRNSQSAHLNGKGRKPIVARNSLTDEDFERRNDQIKRTIEVGQEIGIFKKGADQERAIEERMDEMLRQIVRKSR